jgi:hypothetical protein
MRTLRYFSLLGLLLAFPVISSAQTASFSDVPADSSLYSAVEYLRAQGSMQGYGDGTFRPNAKVNRAEAVKVIISTLSTPPDLSGITQSPYSDVAADAWYLPYVSYAQSKLGIIDGPPKATAFNPGNPVLKAQFLKMFFIANGIDTKSLYSELNLPFSADVSNVNEWYYPHIRYAIATSMTMVTSNGTFGPDRELTRGDIALLLYRYYMYRDGRRTQALLSEAEGEIVNVLQLLDSGNVIDAEMASARSLVASRGALTSKPDEALVKGAVKISEGFRLLVQAYKAGAEKRYADVIKLSSDAWHLADKARSFSSSLSTVADQMQAISKSMADEARKLQG